MADTLALQKAFAARIRDPRHNPLPAGVEARRMRIYEALFFNNLQDFLAGTLPVLRSLLDDAAWEALIRDFLVRHRASSPYFLDIPREFLHFLDQQRPADPRDPPFLRELVHYEWVELALSVAEASQLPGEDPSGDLLEGRPRLSPLAWPLDYRFPVHRIGPDFQPRTAPPEATRLLAYRDADDEVRFLELNPVSARLRDLLAANAENASGRQLLLRIATELRHERPTRLVEFGRQLLEDWRQRGILTGSTRAAVQG
ncbi:putative DNA-binding domain-containing protein [Thiohalobacter sp. IOR34]|uniref:HvfC family RiPP maturation protein n=1 Tax=Thiohalobacter sp. IOR34 TaxID=3057176 RepID=UPI0025AEF3D6|nr:putative DNA-binding domain-containing protein [Thiohalobacter sp. IOR34]WJW76046.1 putative DNA-binding domain-containing protein [Thiohalobacter sp. IOR34]